MYQVKINGRDAGEAKSKNNGGVVYGKSAEPVNIIPLSDVDFHLTQGIRSSRVQVLHADYANKTFLIKVGSNRYTVELADKYDILLKELGMDMGSASLVNDLKAPMPGMVVDVLVEAGQDIKKGDPVIVLEAMKMENVLKAVSDAKVKSVSVQKGAKVEKNETLVALI